MINKFKLFASSVVFALVPFIAAAQTGGVIPGNGGDFGVLLRNILQFSNNVLIPFILGIGFLVFVWGMFRYFIAGGANDEAKESGKSLMVYATLGFVLIIVFWGIVNLVATSTGLDQDSITPPTATNLNV
jgi:cation transporter-like permease